MSSGSENVAVPSRSGPVTGYSPQAGSTADTPAGLGPGGAKQEPSESGNITGIAHSGTKNDMSWLDGAVRGPSDPPTDPWWTRPAPGPVPVTGTGWPGGAALPIGLRRPAGTQWWGAAARTGVSAGPVAADITTTEDAMDGGPTAVGAADGSVRAGDRVAGAAGAVEPAGARHPGGTGGPRRAAPARFRRLSSLPVLALLLAGLLGGVVGGMIGAYGASGGDHGWTASSAPASQGAAGGGTPAPGERSVPVSVIAARVLPSVVTISVVTQAATATGSGVIIRPDGYILTNNHVLANVSAKARVSVTRYQDLQPMPAEIVGRDPRTDLAVIRIRADGPLPAATLGRSGSLVVGAPLVAIGAPLGLAGTVTTGIVSALDRDPTVPVESGGESLLIGAIQTDAAINPGNSGGPLLDGSGQVIGINTAIATVPGGYGEHGMSGNIGVGFAIPIDYAKSVADEIIQTGRATHPHIGVSAVTVAANAPTGAGTSAGVLVRGVEAGGPAALAGLRPGDLITRIGDVAVGSINDLITATRAHRAGERITVTFERDGRAQAAQVTLREQSG